MRFNDLTESTEELLETLNRFDMYPTMHCKDCGGSHGIDYGDIKQYVRRRNLDGENNTGINRRVSS